MPQVNRQYKFVKDQFEVVPQKDLLIKEGFAPVPKGHALELMDLTKLESNNLLDGAAPSLSAVKVKVKSPGGKKGIMPDIK